jgi:23S rRNA (adenine1618-N6)-methyltransferase
VSGDRLKPGLHPRNRFRSGYDFQRLIGCCPALAAFVAPTAYGGESIDFANPAAVKTLNQALLKSSYGLQNWDLPPGHLCPPVPGRSDYLHHLADLLAEGDSSNPPRGPAVVALDIGVGANCIYPLIGASEYGWRFVGTEIDPSALRWAQNIVAANASVAGLIECRLQPSALNAFRDVVHLGEHFDVSLCNPPFHASASEAAAGTRRKLRNLNLGGKRAAPPVLNFGGKAGELWCAGGELGFVQRLIAQSAERPDTCLWFTSLISKSAHLPRLYQALDAARVAEVKTLEMAQGQKRSRILAWTFLNPEARRAWRRSHRAHHPSPAPPGPPPR